LDVNELLKNSGLRAKQAALFSDQKFPRNLKMHSSDEDDGGKIKINNDNDSERSTTDNEDTNYDTVSIRKDADEDLYAHASVSPVQSMDQVKNDENISNHTPKMLITEPFALTNEQPSNFKDKNSSTPRVFDSLGRTIFDNKLFSKLKRSNSQDGHLGAELLENDNKDNKKSGHGSKFVSKISSINPASKTIAMSQNYNSLNKSEKKDEELQHPTILLAKFGQFDPKVVKADIQKTPSFHYSTHQSDHNSIVEFEAFDESNLNKYKEKRRFSHNP
jgi:hypothetical protein